MPTVKTTVNKIKIQYSNVSFKDGLEFNDEILKDFVKFSKMARNNYDQYFVKFPILNEKDLSKKFNYYFEKASYLNKKVDAKTFSKYLKKCSKKIEVISFPNLSKTSLLFIPCPRINIPLKTYRYISDFMCNAPMEQIKQIWKSVGQTTLHLLYSEKSIRINTHGGGVSWLHIRLDKCLIDHEH
jgi:hypothetical protein